jgi:hypothetical protein
MKTILTLVFAISLSPLFGQMFFDFGIKGAYGPTYMLNQNLADDTAYDHELNAGYGVGAKLGLHFASHHGFTFDFMHSKSNQKFGLTNRGLHDYSWTHNDLMLMYRLSGNGAYVEFGPKISLVSDVTSIINGVDEGDVKVNFENNYTSLVFGFGSYLLGNELFSLQIGARIHYALSDMVSAEGITAGYPAVHSSSTFDYNTDYQKTKATAGQILLEFNYAFGRFARASCSHRWRLILFE